MTATGRPTDDFTQRFVGSCMLVRLVAILAALVGLLGSPFTPMVAVCAVLFSMSSLSVLLFPSVTRLLARHPLICVADLLLSLGVIATLGVGSPLVLATLSTALFVGFVFRPVVATLCGFILVAGYVVVALGGGVDTDRFMLVIGVPALYVGLVVVGGTLRHAHHAQVAAAQKLADAREGAAAADERARLAREMHDSVGKTLHGLALAADALPVLVRRDPGAVGPYAAELSSGARRAAKEARDLLARMRADLPDHDLCEIIDERCRAWSAASGVVSTVRTSVRAELPVDIRYELLAILVETLENTRRHAQAGSVVVVLDADVEGRLRMVVTDDGVGFRPSPTGRGPDGHFGLLGMTERARSVGLVLTVDSAPGQGTTVTVASESRVPATSMEASGV